MSCILQFNFLVSSYTRWSGKNVKISDIQAEIRNNGPVNANFYLSDDLIQRGRTDEPYIVKLTMNIFKKSI